VIVNSHFFHFSQSLSQTEISVLSVEFLFFVDHCEEESIVQFVSRVCLELDMFETMILLDSNSQVLPVLAFHQHEEVFVLLSDVVSQVSPFVHQGFRNIFILNLSAHNTSAIITFVQMLVFRFGLRAFLGGLNFRICFYIE